MSDGAMMVKTKSVSLSKLILQDQALLDVSDWELG